MGQNLISSANAGSDAMAANVGGAVTAHRYSDWSLTAKVSHDAGPPP